MCSQPGPAITIYKHYLRVRVRRYENMQAALYDTYSHMSQGALIVTNIRGLGGWRFR